MYSLDDREKAFFYACRYTKYTYFTASGGLFVGME